MKTFLILPLLAILSACTSQEAGAFLTGFGNGMQQQQVQRPAGWHCNLDGMNMYLTGVTSVANGGYVVRQVRDAYGHTAWVQ